MFDSQKLRAGETEKERATKNNTKIENYRDKEQAERGLSCLLFAFSFHHPNCWLFILLLLNGIPLK